MSLQLKLKKMIANVLQDLKQRSKVFINRDQMDNSNIHMIYVLLDGVGRPTTSRFRWKDTIRSCKHTDIG